MEVLRIENLSKSFHGQPIIDNLCLTMKANTIFGLIGKNGSGKTTTMRMILGFLRQSSGEIYVCGEKVKYGDMRTNRYIGYLPDVPAFYDYMNAYSYLILCGKIAGLSKKLCIERIPHLLNLVGLEQGKKKVGSYSRGMKQRLGIAQALLHQPKLLICDEPTSALDPAGRKEILDILLSVKQETAVLFSTHILPDVEKICDEIGILHQGNLKLTGNLDEQKQKHAKKMLRIVLENPKLEERFLHIISGWQACTQIERQEGAFILTVSDIPIARATFFQALLQHEIPIEKFEVIQPSLEQIFLEVTK